MYEKKIVSFIAWLLILPLLILISGCDILDVSDLDDDDNQVRLQLKVDFDITPSPPDASIVGLENECPSPNPTNDVPGYASGNDCDDDGGVIRYTTPKNVSVAVKSITLFNDSQRIPIIDSDTLHNSPTYTFSPDNERITITDNTFIPGDYYVEVELYHIDYTIRMGVPSADTTLRVYLSDDNFPSEGNRGHHQGDITLIDTSTEVGFIQGDTLWDVDLPDTRDGIIGPGGIDSQTGHARGLFGSADLWDQHNFQQGVSEDIYRYSSTSTVAVGNFGRRVQIILPVNSMWFYEDFDNNSIFNPCENLEGSTDEACSNGADWTPIIPTPSISISEL